MSSDGTLAYVPPVSVTAAQRTFVWVDRQGREDAIPAEPRPYVYPRLAPDGTRLALEIHDNLNRNIWVWDFSRGTLTPMTSGATAVQPTWTPDGKGIIFFGSDRSGVVGVLWQAANGTGTAERLFEPTGQQNAPYAMSPDGRRLVLRGASEGSSDLMIVDVPEGRRVQPSSAGVVKPRPLVRTPVANTPGSRTVRTTCLPTADS